MMDFAPFWKTLKESKETTYTLNKKYQISNGTLDRLRKNEPITTTTIHDLCKILNCRVEDIVVYVPDEEE